MLLALAMSAVNTGMLALFASAMALPIACEFVRRQDDRIDLFRDEIFDLALLFGVVAIGVHDDDRISILGRLRFETALHVLIELGLAVLDGNADGFCPARPLRRRAIHWWPRPAIRSNSNHSSKRLVRCKGGGKRQRARVDQRRLLMEFRGRGRFLSLSKGPVFQTRGLAKLGRGPSLSTMWHFLMCIMWRSTSN